MTDGGNSSALLIVSAADGVSVSGRPEFHLRYSAALPGYNYFLYALMKKTLH